MPIQPAQDNKYYPRDQKLYAVTGYKSLQDTLFTTHTKRWTDLTLAFSYCDQRKSVLQSLDEAILFRAEAQGQHSAEHRQITRTYCLIYPERLKGETTVHIAFDDSEYEDLNIILRNAKEIQRGIGAVRSRNTMQVRNALRRAEKGQRICAITKRAFEIPLDCSFEQDPFIQALLTSDARKAYQSHAQERRYTSCKVKLDVPESYTANKAFIHPLHLGPGRHLFIDSTLENFEANKGFACGVRKNHP